MGVMRRNLLFLLAILALVVAPVRAQVTLEESTDAEYLINSGYSQAVAEDVFTQKNRVAGKPIEPLYEKKQQNKFVKVCKRFYAYLDPVAEPEDQIHHDIKRSPSWTDL